jgi:hypothetical protein
MSEQTGAERQPGEHDLLRLAQEFVRMIEDNWELPEEKVFEGVTNDWFLAWLKSFKREIDRAVESEGTRGATPWNPSVEPIRTEMMRRFSDKLSMEEIADFAYWLANAPKPAGGTPKEEQDAIHRAELEGYDVTNAKVIGGGTLTAEEFEPEFRKISDFSWQSRAYWVAMADALSARNTAALTRERDEAVQRLADYEKSDLEIVELHNQREAEIERLKGELAVANESVKEWKFVAEQREIFQRVAEAELTRLRGQWIPVEERLPEDGTSALVYIPQWEDTYLRNQVAWINYDETPPTWINSGESLLGVTHWQPLPAAPSAVPQPPAKEKP